MTSLLTGCATMDEDECRSADWYGIGFDDGVRGRPVSRIGDHREACSEYGIRADTQQYQQGWDRGIRRYCTPANGYRVGLNGSGVRTQCPSSLREEFNRAWHYGKRIYLAERELATNQRTRNDIHMQLDKLKKDRKRVERELVYGGKNKPQKNTSTETLRGLLHREVELEMQLAEFVSEEKKGHNPKGSKSGSGMNDMASKIRASKDREHEGRQHGDKEPKGKEPKGGDHETRAPGHEKNRNKIDEHKERMALERELVQVRQRIHQLEKQPDRDKAEQHKRKMLLLESKKLSQQAGTLRAQMRRLEQDEMELTMRIELLRQNAPY